MVLELGEYRELVMRLLKRQLAGQFRQSFMGYLWVALPPVATAVVFTMLRQANIVNVPMPEGAMPYALFVLIGSTIWGIFSQATLTVTSSVTGGGPLVSKIYFPREILVLSSLGAVMIHAVIRIVVVVATFALFGYVPHIEVLLFPLLLLPIVLLSLGVGMMCAPAHTMMHDMSRMLEFAFQFGMFLAPTVYPTPNLAQADSVWEQGLYWLHTLNPVSHFMSAIRRLAETGSLGWDTGLTCSTLICVLAVFIGWRFFHICEPMLAERI